MALPTSLLSLVERHGCFSGCYGSELDARVCLDPMQPPQPALFVSCRDCLTYKVGVLRALLPVGLTADQLAELVTQHMRSVRGFSDSFGGYHMRAGGFWLNAAYYDSCGLFLIDGARSRAAGSDLDLLLLAFKHGVLAPPDPRMTDPQLFATQVLYVDFSVPVLPVQNKHDLLCSPQCRPHPASGFHRVTLAEFLPLQPALAPPPVAGAAPPAPSAQVVSAVLSGAPSSSTPLPPPRPPRRPLRPGEICPVCHAEVRARPLLLETFVGCLC
jgi:hypothetical protein